VNQEAQNSTEMGFRGVILSKRNPKGQESSSANHLPCVGNPSKPSFILAG
jgi:hypothetical protein